MNHRPETLLTWVCECSMETNLRTRGVCLKMWLRGSLRSDNIMNSELGFDPRELWTGSVSLISLCVCVCVCVCVCSLICDASCFVCVHVYVCVCVCVCSLICDASCFVCVCVCVCVCSLICDASCFVCVRVCSLCRSVWWRWRSSPSGSS